MSTAEPTKTRTLPLFVAGQRLDRETFHERYEAMPPEVWAELVGGVVSMYSRVKFRHGDLHAKISGFLSYFMRFMPGLRGGNRLTTILGDDSEVQPDCQGWLPPEAGGRIRIVDEYLQGPAELVVEVADESRALDLGPKRIVYERAGVQEYLVVTINPDEVRWFALREGRFADLAPGPDGLFRSEVFPGLWLDPSALLAGDLRRLHDALELGLATPEHAEFVARLAALMKSP